MADVVLYRCGRHRLEITFSKIFDCEDVLSRSNFSSANMWNDHRNLDKEINDFFQSSNEIIYAKSKFHFSQNLFN